MAWLPSRLGPGRLACTHAYNSLLRAGADLAGGSDFPVESEDPLRGFYAAVTRTDLTGQPPGGWLPSECLSRQDALRLFTAGNAYAMFAESRRGKVLPGYDADLTVLDRDVMTIPADQIPHARVRMTMVAGRIVYADR
jgi:predicted amidohydrolase YtcJ